MPRPRSLTAASVARAAVAVLDRDGRGALTMRAVAAELRMSTMGLYRYVADRDDLERLMVEYVLGTIDITPPGGRDWTEQITALVDRLRAAVSAHPGVVPLTIAHGHRSGSVLRWSEAVLAVLTDAGFTGPRRVIALRSLLAYVIGAVQLEHLGPLSGPGTIDIAEQSEYPHMARTAADARRIGREEEFDTGLRALLAGIGKHMGPVVG
jgi:AcrR family transcriptional regulator